MEIKGTIIHVLPLQSGTSKQGNPWKKQEYVLETFDNFKTKIKFDLFGDKVDQYPTQVGDVVTVHFDLESREYNGRWYTEVKAWKVDLNERPQSGIAPAPYPQSSYPGTTGELF